MIQITPSTEVLFPTIELIRFLSEQYRNKKLSLHDLEVLNRFYRAKGLIDLAISERHGIEGFTLEQLDEVEKYIKTLGSQLEVINKARMELAKTSQNEKAI